MEMFTRNKIIVYVVVCLTLVGLGAYVASTVKSDDPVRDEAATMKTYSTVHDKKRTTNDSTAIHRTDELCDDRAVYLYDG